MLNWSQVQKNMMEFGVHLVQRKIRQQVLVKVLAIDKINKKMSQKDKDIIQRANEFTLNLRKKNIVNFF